MLRAIQAQGLLERRYGYYAARISLTVLAFAGVWFLFFVVGESWLQLLVAGLGIASVALWNCRAELASGALVQVLADWQMDPIELHAVFAVGRAAKPSARAFADYLATALRE